MQDEPFCVVGIAKINNSTVDLAYRHNNRLMPVPSSKLVQMNFDMPVEQQAKKFASNRKTLRELIDERLKLLGAKKTRKDSVLAIEILLSTANGFFNQDQSSAFHPENNCNKPLLTAWLNKCNKFLESKFQKNLIQVSLHLDETTPHLHAFVMPLKHKTIKIPSKGHVTHSKKEWRLCASDFMNKSWYRKMHDDYADAMQEFGLVRGLLHSKSKNIDISDFVTLVNEREKIKLELVRLRDEANKLSNQNEKFAEKNKLLYERFDSLNREKERCIQELKSMSHSKDELEEISQSCSAEVSKLRKELSDLKGQGITIKRENDNLLRYRDEFINKINHDFREHITFSRDIGQIISKGIEDITIYSELIKVTSETRELKSTLQELNERINKRQQQFHLEHKDKAEVSSGPHNSLNKLIDEKQARETSETRNGLKR